MPNLNRHKIDRIRIFLLKASLIRESLRNSTPDEHFVYSDLKLNLHNMLGGCANFCVWSERPLLKDIDEPTVGLHSEDIALLIPIFQSLADKKNTLVIIEHNIDLILNAYYIIDLGPDAGPHGGEIIATGTPEEVKKVKQSKTAKYL